MRVNSINNNYNSQNQQNFGAIAGKNFEKGLVGYLTNLRYDALKETMTLLNTPNAVKQFVEDFRNIKVARTGGQQDLSPVFSICNFDNQAFYLEGMLNGERLGGGQLSNEPKTNLFNMLLARIKTALSGYELAPIKTFCSEHPINPTDKSIRQSVHDLVKLLNKDNEAEIV